MRALLKFRFLENEKPFFGSCLYGTRCFALFIHLFAYLPIYLSTYPFFFPFSFLSIFSAAYLSIRLSVYLSMNLLIRPPFYVPTFLLTYLPIFLFFRLFRYPFIYLPLCLSIFYISLYLCIYLPIYFPFRLSISRFTWPSICLIIFWSRFLSVFIFIISFENSLFIYAAAFLFAHLPNMAPKKIEAEPLVAILKRVPPCLQAATSWRTSAVRPKSLGFRV